MYDIIKQAIANGGYKLSAIQNKIKRLWIMGDLTEDQMDELLALAQDGAQLSSERPELLDMVQGLFKRVDALEQEIAALKVGGEVTPEQPETPEIEAWQPWDGVSNKHQLGAVVTHKGKIWESTLDGQNVWEPGTVSFWADVTEKYENMPDMAV